MKKRKENFERYHIKFCFSMLMWGKCCLMINHMSLASLQQASNSSDASDHLPWPIRPPLKLTTWMWQSWGKRCVDDQVLHAPINLYLLPSHQLAAFESHIILDCSLYDFLYVQIMLRFKSRYMIVVYRNLCAHFHIFIWSWTSLF